MALPTRVNIINDSSERIKVKIDNDKDGKYDKITNIEPGSRLDGIEGSSGSKLDVIVDIITNPAGPDNNTLLGSFSFNNPILSWPYVVSVAFTTLGSDFTSPDPRVYLMHRLFRGDLDGNKRYWGKFDDHVLDQSKSFATNVALLVNAAPKPTFTTEAFFDDDAAGAKVWDLRINSDNFTL